MSIPYTYLIKFKPTGQVYYGSRTAKDCHPDELWVKYFTSSPTIKALRNEYGDDAFEYEVRKIFETKKDCLVWESKVLVKFNARKNPMWLNKHNSDGKFTAPGLPHTKESRLKMSRVQKGRKKSPEHMEKLRQLSIGRKASNETRKKMSIAHKGKIQDPEWVRNRIESKMSTYKHKKRYKITYNTGETKEFININVFCAENYINVGSLYALYNGRIKRSKNIIELEIYDN